MRLLFLFAVLLLFPFSQELLAQDKTVMIHGKITSGDSEERVPFVYIYNERSRTSTLSDTLGRFEIEMRKADTLIFSSLGYDSYELYFTEKFLGDRIDVTIEMDPKTYTLSTVQVHAYKPIELFKKEILELDLEPEGPVYIAGIPQMKKRMSTAPPGEITLMRIDGPISAVKDFVKYNFTKRGKLQKSFQKYAKAYDSRSEIRAIYSPEFVAQVTGFEADRLRSFMVFCKLSDNFILHASTYELTLAILLSKKEFEITTG